MKHLKAVNRKARRVEEFIASEYGDVHALQQGPPQQPRPHYPLGCSLVFSPGWETDSAGGTAGLCQPVERDLYDCYITCFWPAQVPDHFNNYPDWTSKCASATKDWRNIDLVFP
ncbi:MAG TPA: quinohemoprotein amine dehydrogenase subunit gamma [Blastocatellia bacterium]|jgi:hypothetical protein|nr:quinohemoprotein amine dehydrogenase subunit gamma [Blastocatellia bacterium]